MLTFGSDLPSDFEKSNDKDANRNSNLPIKYNPLRLSLNDKLRIDSMDLAGIEFTVDEVLTTKFNYCGEEVNLTDYNISGEAVDPDSLVADYDGQVRLRLRYVPIDGKDYPIALQIIEEHEPESNLLDVLRTSPQVITLHREADKTRIGTFHRIDKVELPYSAKREVFVRVENGGPRDYKSLLRCDISYWDYQTPAVDRGIDYDLYAVIEKNNDTGEGGLMLGWDIDPADIKVL